MSRYERVSRKLWKASAVLASSPAPLQSRLADAWYLCHLASPLADEADQPFLSRFRGQVSATELNSDGPDESPFRLTDDEASATALRLMDLAWKYHRLAVLEETKREADADA